MIAEIQSKTEYGKQGTIGINLLPELSDDPIISFAHSVEDAIKWAQEHPLYQDAIVDDMGNGIIAIHSQWKAREISVFEETGLWENNELKNAGFERSTLIIRPMNTIYENTGFQGYRFVARD